MSTILNQPVLLFLLVPAVISLLRHLFGVHFCCEPKRENLWVKGILSGSDRGPRGRWFSLRRFWFPFIDLIGFRAPMRVCTTGGLG